MGRRAMIAVAVLGGLVLASALTVLAVGRPTPSASPQTVGTGPAEPVDYVALGDSFTAAPLVPDVREDAPGCFRSTRNYPAHLAELLQVASVTDVSCSAARSADVTTGQRAGLAAERPPQADALSADTDLVTVGLGGNDFGLFGSIAGDCGRGVSWRSAATPCRDAYVAGGSDRKLADARRIRGTLRSALAAIASRAPRAEVYVVGYPRLLPESGSCRAAGFTVDDAAWARRVQARLNRSLRQAATDAGATYVNLYPSSRGHDICAGDQAWVNGRRLQLGRALAYHPFAEGQRATAAAIYQAVTGNSAPISP